jgi:hypothetical protein
VQKLTQVRHLFLRTNLTCLSSSDKEIADIKCMLYRKRLAVQGREKNIDKELFDLPGIFERY